MKITAPSDYDVKCYELKTETRFHLTLATKKNGGFLKQILSTSIQEKLIEIGDG